MDEKESVKTFLFTSYSSAAYEIIRQLIDADIKLEGVLFSPENIKRISWKEHARNVLCGRGLREPRKILSDNSIPYRFTDDHNGDTSKAMLRDSNADILLLYGTKIIHAEVLQIPKIGCLNAHSALLPKYRGGKSEFWLLYNNEPQYAGVTIHWVTPGLDEGDIFLQEPLIIVNNDTPDTLRKKSIPLAGKLFVEAVKNIENKNIIRLPQDASKATKYKRPTQEERDNFKKRNALRKK